MGEKPEISVGPHSARFGAAVRRERERKAWSQLALAQRVSYESHGMIASIESGRKAPSFEMACELALALGISLDALVTLSAPPGATPPGLLCDSDVQEILTRLLAWLRQQAPDVPLP
jgi:transcriptional regulator with XRE-family HTH domain